MAVIPGKALFDMAVTTLEMPEDPISVLVEATPVLARGVSGLMDSVFVLKIGGPVVSGASGLDETVSERADTDVEAANVGTLDVVASVGASVVGAAGNGTPGVVVSSSEIVRTLRNVEMGETMGTPGVGVKCPDGGASGAGELSTGAGISEVVVSSSVIVRTLRKVEIGETIGRPGGGASGVGGPWGASTVAGLSAGTVQTLTVTE